MTTVVPPISSEHYERLGRLTAGAAHLDGICETLIGALAGGANDQPGQERIGLLTQGMRTSSLVGMVRRLSVHADDDADALQQWATRVDKADQKRNDTVHTVWLFQYGDHAVTLRRRTRSGSEFQLVSIAELEAILAAQDHLIGTGLDFAKKVGAV